MSEEYTVVSRRRYDGKEYVKLQRHANGNNNAGSVSQRKFWDSTNRYGGFGWDRRSGLNQKGGKGGGKGGKGKGTGGKGSGKGSGRSPDTTSTQSKNLKICHHWNGKDDSCPYGKTCKFPHHVKPQSFCRFFQKGTCNRGADRRFGHIAETKAKMELSSDESRFAESMEQVLKHKVGLDASSAAHMSALEDNGNELLSINWQSGRMQCGSQRKQCKTLENK